MKRCGDCPQCIEVELRVLSTIEASLWRRSAGDFTRYLDLMAAWIDQFNTAGIPD